MEELVPPYHNAATGDTVGMGGNDDIHRVHDRCKVVAPLVGLTCEEPAERENDYNSKVPMHSR